MTDHETVGDLAAQITSKVIDIIEAAENDRHAEAEPILSSQEWCHGMAQGLMAGVVLFTFSSGAVPPGDGGRVEEFLRRLLRAVLDIYQELDEEGSMLQ